MPDDIVIEVQASQPRRIFGVGVMAVLAAAVLYLVTAGGGSTLGARVFLVVLGLGAFALAARMWVVSRQHLVLTRTDLRMSGGEVLTTLDNIDTLDRGMFAFKPSNGFILRLGAAQPVRWAPGMWWRLGRRIGVGGVTNAPQSKAMAEIITAQLAARRP